MGRLLVLVLVLLLGGLPSLLHGRALAVVVHPSNPVKRLSRHEVLDLFMGRRRVFPGGGRAIPFDQSGSSAAKICFYRELAGMTLPQVDAYWARLLFTGQMTPPQTLPGGQAVLERVRRTPGAIGYVDAVQIDHTVKTVLVVEDAS